MPVSELSLCGPSSLGATHLVVIERHRLMDVVSNQFDLSISEFLFFGGFFLRLLLLFLEVQLLL